MAESHFGAALQREPMPRRIGDVRLRYDAELLIGEKVPPLDGASLLPDALVLAGGAAGMVAMAMLVAPSLRVGSVWGTMGAAALAAAAMLAGLRLGGLRHGRRGFVVNFHRYVVRVDQPHGLRIRSATTELPFSELREVRLEERGPDRAALVLAAERRTYLLVDAIRDRERSAAARLRGMLEAAFVTPPAGG